MWWGLRRSDVHRCHAVSEQHGASCKRSFSQLVLVPRVRKPPALLAFSLRPNSELLSPVKYHQHGLEQRAQEQRGARSDLARLFMELLVLNGELFSSSSPHFPVCLQKYSGLHLKGKTVCAGTEPTCLFTGNTIFPSLSLTEEGLTEDGRLGWVLYF